MPLILEQAQLDGSGDHFGHAQRVSATLSASVFPAVLTRAIFLAAIATTSRRCGRFDQIICFFRFLEAPSAKFDFRSAIACYRRASRAKMLNRMKMRRILTAAMFALAFATTAHAQTIWTCQTYPTVGGLAAKLQTLTPDALETCKIVLREFQSVSELKAADATPIEGAKAVPIPGTKLGAIVFVDQLDLLIQNIDGSISDDVFTSHGAVADALNTLPDAEADAAKVFAQEFAAQKKGQKRTPIAQLRLDDQFILFYLAPFAEAETNACGKVGPPPTPTPTAGATATPTKTATPTAVATTMNISTPTQTPTSAPSVGVTPTPTAAPSLTAVPTPTQACLQFGGQPCGSPSPTPIFASPTPTEACVQFGGEPCGSATPTPTAIFASPTPTQACVQFGGQPCPTPTPAP